MVLKFTKISKYKIKLRKNCDLFLKIAKVNFGLIEAFTRIKCKNATC